MTTLAKKITTQPQAPRRNWKMFTAFILEKIGENIQDMVITIAALGMLLAYLFITVPDVTVEYSGYIIAVYLIILFRRIVHDFDESYTLDELGDRIDLILRIQQELYRRVREEGSLTDSDLEERLNSLM
jgi:hypothetical protein